MVLIFFQRIEGQNTFPLVTFYFQGNDDDIKEMSFNQILNLVASDGRKLQFYPGIKV